MGFDDSDFNRSKPTIEEFKTAAIKKLEPMIESMRKAENLMTAAEFIETQDGQDALRDAYKSAVAEYNRGELSREIFMGDAASGLAYCLYMLYE